MSEVFPAYRDVWIFNTMTEWHLNNRIETSAGKVAAGSTGSGPPLVLAHGWPWSSFSWHKIIPYLADRYTVYWYDMPGYGRSGMDPGQATGLDVQGTIFVEVLAFWEMESPSVIAHDFGGATSLRAHLLSGVDFSRYVLMNVVAMRPWGSAFFEHVGRHIDAFLGVPAHIHAAIVEAYIKGALVTLLPETDLEGLVAPWLTEDGRVSFYRQFAQADERFTKDIEPMFGEIRCPVSILWGADDPWIPIDRGRALKERIGTERFTALAGLGHLPQLEAPERVARALFQALSVA